MPRELGASKHLASNGATLIRHRYNWMASTTLEMLGQPALSYPIDNSVDGSLNMFLPTLSFITPAAICIAKVSQLVLEWFI
ncbi:hypothetical protein BC628DRAFT_1420447 [Trametes gibbosa]|nr:hypothetical protein BC628DRAFT_1420447 [Trametes gibbosa]